MSDETSTPDEIRKELTTQFEEAGEMSSNADRIWQELCEEFKEAGVTPGAALERLREDQFKALREIQFREKAAREKEQLTHRVHNLAMLVRRLAHQLERRDPENRLLESARDHLRKHGLDGIPIREDWDEEGEELQEFLSMKNHYRAIVELARELKQAEKDKADLAIFVQRLSIHLEKADPNNHLFQRARDYLRSHGLDGTPP